MKKIIKEVLRDIKQNYWDRGVYEEEYEKIEKILRRYSYFYDNKKKIKDMLEIIDYFYEDILYWHEIENFKFNDYLIRTNKKEIEKVIKFLKSMV